MASAKNDALQVRTVEGSLNYYDNHRSCGTACDKAIAANVGGHNYNIITNSDQHEIYLTSLRHGDHCVDQKGRHTRDFFGSRRRKFATDERGLITETMRHPGAHPREHALAQRRAEIQLAQMENSQSYRGFQNRSQASLVPSDAPKRYSINNKRYANEAEKLRPQVSQKAAWLQRRGEVLPHCMSAPSLKHSDPVGSLDQAIHDDARKEATQRQTESAHFAPWQAANTYSSSMDSTSQGKQMVAGQRHTSVTRLENHDFAVARKNNHYSSEDKLTRSDPFFMRPRLSVSNNSVKYDIVNNERRWFRY
mmetsp:Transcript_118919/g.371840  ORF Transcript_118919/g.371840 Transcript_118919/m.371840 type:complete len:307 (-) Transcript_118919:60-980(-)